MQHLELGEFTAGAEVFDPGLSGGLTEIEIANVRAGAAGNGAEFVHLSIATGGGGLAKTCLLSAIVSARSRQLFAVILKPGPTMDPLLTLVTIFAIFIPALMLPGPDFVAVVRSSMSRGARAGLMTTLGVSISLLMYATLSLVGLAAVLVEYQWLTWTVRVAGGAYLAYLGVKLLLAKPETLEIKEGDPSSEGNPLLFGFLVTLTNPKAIVLFASVFATAVTDATPVWLMAVIIAIVFASSMIWYSVVSLFMSSTPVMKRFDNARHWIERAAGVCFIGIGGKIMADARNPISP
ncbi:MAG: LysE family translocator [Pseudomonadota bacterium]